MAKTDSITYPAIPNGFFIDEVKWKFLCRSVQRGKNVMIIGQSGCGKTVSVYHIASALKRKIFKFNMGATQDPRSELIGNTHFDVKSGTYVAESEFLNAIQTKDAIILLDEISRAHPDAWNILMTVLDPMQKYVRVSEKPGSPVVNVAPGVSFLLTANIGTEYTGTRSMDRALLDRCQLLEVDMLDYESELALLKYRSPTVNEDDLSIIASIASEIRTEFKSDASRIDTVMSTRMSLETAELLSDGFTFSEAAQVCIYPFFSEAGGNESSRSFVKKIVQKYVGSSDSATTTKLPWG